MAITTTAISLDEDLLARIHERAEALKLPLSSLLTIAAEEYLDRPRRGRLVQGEDQERLLAQINGAWEGGLDTQERAALRGAKSKYRRVIKDSW